MKRAMYTMSLVLLLCSTHAPWLNASADEHYDVEQFLEIFAPNIDFGPAHAAIIQEISRLRAPTHRRNPRGIPEDPEEVKMRGNQLRDRELVLDVLMKINAIVSDIGDAAPTSEQLRRMNSEINRLRQTPTLIFFLEAYRTELSYRAKKHKEDANAFPLPAGTDKELFAEMKRELQATSFNFGAQLDWIALETSRQAPANKKLILRFFVDLANALELSTKHGDKATLYNIKHSKPMLFNRMPHTRAWLSNYQAQ